MMPMKRTCTAHSCFTFILSWIMPTKLDISFHLNITLMSLKYNMSMINFKSWKCFQLPHCVRRLEITTWRFEFRRNSKITGGNQAVRLGTFRANHLQSPSTNLPSTKQYHLYVVCFFVLILSSWVCVIPVESYICKQQLKVLVEVRKTTLFEFALEFLNSHFFQKGNHSFWNEC